MDLQRKSECRMKTTTRKGTRYSYTLEQEEIAVGQETWNLNRSAEQRCEMY